MDNKIIVIIKQYLINTDSQKWWRLKTMYAKKYLKKYIESNIGVIFLQL